MRMRLMGMMCGGVLALCAVTAADGQKVAATPPMGWNSWNFFNGKVTDKDIRDTADLLVSSGMRDAGYVYVNIDDTWEGERDAQGRITSNSKFPDMKALSAYVHLKGLKLGIYSSPGPTTCARFPGSLGHEEQDAQTYADWGIDYLKYDLCSYGGVMRQQAPNDSAEQEKLMRDAYEKMHQALVKTGRPIVYSLCQYGFNEVWKWGPSVGANLWRTTGDVQANFDRIMLIGRAQAGLAKYAAPGHWNDPDMLEVGNGGMTKEEYRTHFSMWAMWSAPLLAGNDIANMTADTKEILLNKEVIAIDQDALGQQASRVKKTGDLEVWSKQLADGGRAVALVNRGPATAQISASWTDIGYPEAVSASVHDLWTRTDSAAKKGGYSAEVPSHGVVMVRIKPQ
jgi:alpha-galactosidase